MFSVAAPHDHITLSNRSHVFHKLSRNAEALRDAEAAVQMQPCWAKVGHGELGQGSVRTEGPQLIARSSDPFRKETKDSRMMVYRIPSTRSYSLSYGPACHTLGSVGFSTGAEPRSEGY